MRLLNRADKYDKQHSARLVALLLTIGLLLSSCGSDPRQDHIKSLEDTVDGLRSQIGTLEEDNAALRTRALSSQTRLGGRTTLMLGIVVSFIISVLVLYALNSNRRAHRYEALLQGRLTTNPTPTALAAYPVNETASQPIDQRALAPRKNQLLDAEGRHDS